MRNVAGVAFAAMALVACASHAPPTPAKTVRDATWLAALAQRPDGDADRQCVRGALQVAFALVAFKDGGFDDAAVRRALVGNVADKRLRAQREAALTEWLRTHEPSLAATAHLNACLSESGNALAASNAWPRCFLSVEPAALFSIYRRAGASLSQAVQAVAPYYPIDVNPSLIAELGKFVFDLVTDADDVRFREDLFTDCLAVAAD
jgi:hypothetical protein